MSIKLYSQEYKIFNQGSYWITWQKDKWEKTIVKNSVVLFFDTTYAYSRFELNLQLASSIYKELNRRKVTVEYTFVEPIKDSSILVYYIRQQIPRRVKLSLFNTDLPLCYKFIHSFFNDLENESRKNSEISISTLKTEEGINNVAKKIAKKIKKKLN